MCTVECTEGEQTGPEYKMQVNMSLCLNCQSRCVSWATCSTNMRHNAATCLQLVLEDIYSNNSQVEPISQDRLRGDLVLVRTKLSKIP